MFSQIKHKSFCLCFADSFIESGIPQGIIKNFLKSVQKAAETNVGKPHSQKRRNPEAEADDSGLNYEQVSVNDILGQQSRALPSIDGNQSSTLVKIGGPQIVIVSQGCQSSNVLVNTLESPTDASRVAFVSSNAAVVEGDTDDQYTDAVKTDTLETNSGASKDSQSLLHEENKCDTSSNKLTPDFVENSPHSGDEDEIRSSTGDILLDHEQDFQDGDGGEEWLDYNQLEMAHSSA